MKIATKVMFASTLMFSVIAPSLSYAAYFVDQTKSWALETRAKEVMDKVTRHKVGAGQTQVSRERSLGFYGTGNTSVPGASFDKDDTTPKSK
ncbi:MAG: hypothetical protein WBW13_25160 [Pseudolabrys sp.]|jgi:hypothetical protein|nr:hypothetical protein [Pseudolabrys sp.]